MDHRSQKEVLELEADIESAFAQFEKDEFNDMLAGALAGEYFGYSTFAALAADSSEKPELHFWECARDIEGMMIRNLEPLLDSSGIPRPEKSMYVGIGERTAAIFAGEPHQDYCTWVGPRIDAALTGLLRLQALSEPGPARTACDELVAHELALMSAWAVLSNGFAAAAKPLAAHLNRGFI
ncbi:hypothetical protein [Sphingobium vermicomposti]|uniref:Uncharacterized protein n=1 Tax=Sphingobium vermicomposti TaxID=529005 RepID=A0A846M7J4_9SPHN|nr:hypothetical protein [Sphingobium vermicomposti]NIJ17862.1 hypothetical protein [Sphingobium vermicomposti]